MPSPAKGWGHLHGGVLGIVLVVAAVAITCGAATIAIAAGRGPGGHAATGVARGDHSSGSGNASSLRLQSTPIVIPPAPSLIVIPAAPSTTVPSTTAPPSSEARVSTARVAAPSARPRVAAPAPAQVHTVGGPLPRGTPGAAMNITDPSTVAVARVRTLPLYASPGATQASSTMANPNNLGATVVLLVTAVQPNWVEAYIPVRPNETMAWIPAADVALTTVGEHIVVHLGDRQLILYRNNQPVYSAPVAPGASDAPTPTGSFFVAYKVRVTDPSGPYGPDAFGTSDFSGTYYSFDGGPGQIGIHGTDQPWVIGTYASHGCIRLYNNDIATLAQQVVPGTPVEVEN
ncbi:MAG: L,D-transpeptidase family protein [Acidimicrobiales bacterium]